MQASLLPAVRRLLLLLACAAPALEAAPVAWSTSSISGPSDVITTGTLVGALNAGQGSTVQTINGVVFAADPGGTSAIPLGTATVTLSMTFFFNDFWSAADPGGSAAYAAALNYGRYNDIVASGTVVLGSLVPGRTYLVQLWIADPRGCCNTRIRTVDGVATSANGPQIATGTFTADTATQVITIASTDGPQLNMLQLRAVTVQGGQRDSTNYSIATDTADGGGRRATSAAYTHDGSFSGIAGLSTAAAPAETVKHSYIGQLYDIVGFVLNPTGATVPEGGTLQLSAGQLLDDATQLAVPATSVAWSVVAGQSFASINATTGLVTAGSVYQPTPATAQGIHAGNTSTLPLTVLNGSIDNFGAYAGDTLDDAWQVQYFGQPPNANAAPLVDFDRDGQTNAFEYTAGLIPTDANSVFRLRIEKVPSQSTQKNLIFSPRLTDRTYTVRAKASLLTVGGWTPITGSAPSDAGQERTITDLSATGVTKFYQVEIVKP